MRLLYLLLDSCTAISKKVTLTGEVAALYPHDGSNYRVIRNLPNGDTICDALFDQWYLRYLDSPRMPVDLLATLPRQAPVEAIEATAVALVGYDQRNPVKVMNPKVCVIVCGDLRSALGITALDFINPLADQSRKTSSGPVRLKCPPGQEIMYGQRYSAREYSPGLEDVPLMPKMTYKCWCVIVTVERETSTWEGLQEEPKDAAAYKALYDDLVDLRRAQLANQDHPREMNIHDMVDIVRRIRQIDRPQMIQPVEERLPRYIEPAKPRTKGNKRARKSVSAQVRDAARLENIQELRDAVEVDRSLRDQVHEEAESSAAAQLYASDDLTLDYAMAQWDQFNQVTSSISMTSMAVPQRSKETDRGKRKADDYMSYLCKDFQYYGYDKDPPSIT